MKNYVTSLIQPLGNSNLSKFLSVYRLHTQTKKLAVLKMMNKFIRQNQETDIQYFSLCSVSKCHLRKN